MNPCHEYRDKILRYLDDDLQAHELNDFRNHLKACPDSRGELRSGAGAIEPTAPITALISSPGCTSLPRVCGRYAAARTRL
jgi:Putative zinc-finger